MIYILRGVLDQDSSVTWNVCYFTDGELAEEVALLATRSSYGLTDGLKRALVKFSHDWKPEDGTYNDARDKMLSELPQTNPYDPDWSEGASYYVSHLDVYPGPKL